MHSKEPDIVVIKKYPFPTGLKLQFKLANNWHLVAVEKRLFNPCRVLCHLVRLKSGLFCSAPIALQGKTRPTSNL